MEINYSRMMLMAAGFIFAVVIIGMIFIRDKEVDTDVTRKTTRVGLIITGAKDDSNFCQTHYDALMNIKDDLNLVVICKDHIPEDESCLEAAKELVDDYGCKFIIGASYGYGEYMIEAAKLYPDICFLHPFGTEKLTNLSSCQGRMYQVKYLEGITAGMRTESGELGYVSTFPFAETIANINAFTLGARSVAPDAKVYVKYCNSWTDDDAAEAASKKLLELHPGIDVMSMHTNSLMPNYVADERGIYSSGFNKDNSELFPDSYLAACEWRWDDYYKEKILSCLQGKFYGKMDWMDISSGILDLSELTKNAAPGTKEAVDEARKRMTDRNFDVFYGPITDNKGELRIPENESMSDDEMLNWLDWYVEGVIVEE